MYAVQQPLAATALQDVMGVPAWKSLPPWYLVADGDQAIPPDAERQFGSRMGATTIEVPTNHVAMVPTPLRRAWAPVGALAAWEVSYLILSVSMSAESNLGDNEQIRT
jgi:hypothetical protein